MFKKSILLLAMILFLSTKLYAGWGIDEVKVGGFTKTISNTPTITAGAYSSGQCVGGLQTVSNAGRFLGGSGVVNSVIIADKGKQNAQLSVVFFNANPTSTTFTDNGALTIADADLSKIVGVVTVLAADYVSFADNSVGTTKNQGLSFVCSGSADLYYTVVSYGTPTYTSTSDLIVKVKLFQD